MIPRILSAHALHCFRQYPVVTVTGPRQSGKTTLVRELFKDKPYANLEHPGTRGLAVWNHGCLTAEQSSFAWCLF